MRVPLNILASQNRSDNFSGFRVGRNKLVLLRGVDYKRVVATGFYAVVYGNIPIFKRLACGFDFPLYALFDGREYRPTFGTIKF